MVHVLQRPETCETFLAQASNLCPLHWQADSFMISHVISD